VKPLLFFDEGTESAELRRVPSSRFVYDVVAMRQDNTIVYSIKIIVSTLVQGMKIQNIIYTYKCVNMTRLQNNLIVYTIVLQTNLKDLFVNLIH
jgi:hypothetical protein